MPKVVLLAEAWGDNEARIKRALVGASGIELLKMLGEANIIELTDADFSYIRKFYENGDPAFIDAAWGLHPEVYRTNVFNFHPLGNRVESLCGDKKGKLEGYPSLIKGRYVRAEFEPELLRLGRELIEVNPNLVLCLGNTSMWSMLGETAISKLRGTTDTSTHTASGFKVLPTYHPAAVLRQWELRPTVVLDLMKACREAEFPEVRRPKREIWIEPTLEDLDAFRNLYIHAGRTISVDIETSGNQITCIGFASGPSVSIVIPFLDTRRKDKSYWKNTNCERLAWDRITAILRDRHIPKVFQNGLYDIAFLWRAYGIRVMGAEHDTMLLHHALQPESLKGLGFLGSIYSDEGSWKHMRAKHETIKSDE